MALEALKGMETLSQVAAKYEVHPAQVGAWKKGLLDGASSLFGRKNAKMDGQQEQQIETLERKVGQLTWRTSTLKKSLRLGIPGRGRR